MKRPLLSDRAFRRYIYLLLAQIPLALLLVAVDAVLWAWLPWAFWVAAAISSFVFVFWVLLPDSRGGGSE